MKVLVHVVLALSCMVGLFMIACFIGEHGMPWWRVGGMLVITWSMFCVWAAAIPDMQKVVVAIRGLK